MILEKSEPIYIRKNIGKNKEHGVMTCDETKIYRLNSPKFFEDGTTVSYDYKKIMIE